MRVIHQVASNANNYKAFTKLLSAFLPFVSAIIALFSAALCLQNCKIKFIYEGARGQKKSFRHNKKKLQLS